MFFFGLILIYGFIIQLSYSSAPFTSDFVSLWAVDLQQNKNIQNLENSLMVSQFWIKNAKNPNSICFSFNGLVIIYVCMHENMGILQ